MREEVRFRFGSEEVESLVVWRRRGKVREVEEELGLGKWRRVRVRKESERK